MQKLGFPGLSIDKLKSLSGSGAKKTLSSSSLHQEHASSGSFVNLRLIAEKLVKEHASVKTDLELANSKVKKSADHIRLLEEKLQNAYNENATLKVKQKEDEKLWLGLESKFSATKTLCDQLTETLRHLASQVDVAEKDKECFEGKIAAGSGIIDNLNQQMYDLSSKLIAAEENIQNREKELTKLKSEKDEKEKLYRDEQLRDAKILKEKDAKIRNFEVIVSEKTSAAEKLNSKLDEIQRELESKGNKIQDLVAIQLNLEKENTDLQLKADDLSQKLTRSQQEMGNLNCFVNVLAKQLADLNEQNLNFSGKYSQLNTLYETCFQLIQAEKGLASEQAERSFFQLHHRFLSLTSEKDVLQSAVKELEDKVVELEKGEESLIKQLADERCLASEKIQKLESETQFLVSKRKETESIVSKLKDEVKSLSENLGSSEHKTEQLLLKLSASENAITDKTEKMQAVIEKKDEAIEALWGESGKLKLQLDSQEAKIQQFQNLLNEKDQLIQQHEETHKKLEENINENKAMLNAAESRLVEAKKQYDLMLESKQAELSRHLKELSLRNDQEINEIRRKYEEEKQGIVSAEKQKAEKVIEDVERRLEREIADCKEVSRQQLMRIQEEHSALVRQIQEEHERKELCLKAQHDEELRRSEIQADSELREKMTSLRNEHEVQLKAFKSQYEDDCKRLEDELNLQRSREERQKALLQLQWKVMSDNPPQEQEVNSGKEYSVSSIKMRNSHSGGNKIRQHPPMIPAHDEKESPFLESTRTPVSKLINKAEIVNAGSMMSYPSSHRKVTRHEYEIETNNGGTITKRRKTRSTVMFEDPRRHKKRSTPTSKTPRNFPKATKVGGPHSANIGDLFSEGSLNPYTDDPYAFD